MALGHFLLYTPRNEEIWFSFVLSLSPVASWFIGQQQNKSSNHKSTRNKSKQTKQLLYESLEKMHYFVYLFLLGTRLCQMKTYWQLREFVPSENKVLQSGENVYSRSKLPPFLSVKADTLCRFLPAFCKSAEIVKTWEGGPGQVSDTLRKLRLTWPAPADGGIHRVSSRWGLGVGEGRDMISVRHNPNADRNEYLVSSAISRGLGMRHAISLSIISHLLSRFHFQSQAYFYLLRNLARSLLFAKKCYELELL